MVSILRIVFGLALIGAAIAGATGLADRFVVLPPLDLLSAAGLTAAGLVFIWLGVLRRRQSKDADRAYALAVQQFTLSGVMLVLAVTFAVPLLAEVLDLVRVGGFPIGFYFAAQGGVLLLAILAFMMSSRAERIDDTHSAGDGT